VFSVLNALVQRPLNVPQPESLFMVQRAYSQGDTPAVDPLILLREE
jgi:hypothetical protein